ncbi:polyprenyl synthetase family protein [Desulfobacter latus]|uniref:Polyprenyl synthetase family protein n=1 Tax=Desulfobacter latus TaxID=2292 RepID=A0A850TAS9_9BACT|nr:farnesyl diphosphate synthase [Desulfobacter latus]NWH06505.1 polyprenyl synthetase family protein [Desulfobacter latus]
MSTFDLSGYLSRNRNLVDAALLNVFHELDQHRELVRAMTHSLMAGGKRVRPALALATAGALGADPRIALPASCAIEMIHTYSLIHDDLPAMDDDDLRRGMPTCHKQFSEATAILAGDGLLTHAFHILAAPGSCFDIYPDTDTRLILVEKISAAAGINGMVEGQMLDMQAENNPEDLPLDRPGALAHLKKIHRHKTGAMIEVSVASGAISAGADKDALNALGTYAENIGLAFQVMDDILNVEGDPKVMGKAAGSDALRDKLTFPAILGLEESKVFSKQLVADALTALDSYSEKEFKKNSEPLRAIAGYIINRNR